MHVCQLLPKTEEDRSQYQSVRVPSPQYEWQVRLVLGNELLSVDNFIRLNGYRSINDRITYKYATLRIANHLQPIIIGIRIK